jgi:hypothetical protein
VVATYQSGCRCSDGLWYRSGLAHENRKLARSRVSRPSDDRLAWGQYQDYLDGRNHWDEAQQERDGKLILHGGNPRVPYMSPGESYGRYLTRGVERSLNAGAEAIYLEEPEFWARGGYEENFKREWKAFYGEEWQPPDSSPDAQYRASKLKYYLYRRALSQIFDFVKQYGKAHGRSIPCYVPAHS